MNAKLAELCIGLGERAADAGGFVALHKLMALLHAEIEFRPLLVEGVVAAPKGPGFWRILIDSETHGHGENFAAESAERPLPARLRNTVAHELLHTLSFRSEEFGVTLESEVRETRTATVRRLERETEALSPLLLIPQNALQHALDSAGVTLDELIRWRERWSVSREVLVSRLRLAQQQTGSGRSLRFHDALKNVLVLVGEWESATESRLLPWPIFANFADGVTPEFVWRLRENDSIQTSALWPQKEFSLNGGATTTQVFESKAGTETHPSSESMHLSCSVEVVPKQRGERFLVYMRGV